jgi:predicted TPR repeat methyltransferase
MCRRLIEGGKASPPDLASAYAILGRAQLNTGKTDEGVASLKKSIELDPKGRFASQSEDILRALKKL